MELILKKDNKTLEFVSGSQEVNVNDDLVQIISVMPEMPLLATESLWVAFEQNGTVAHTLPLLGDEERYTADIPQGIIDLGSEWEFQILRRRYATSEHEGGFKQTASNKGAFTIGEGVKTVDGTIITTAMLTTLYREVVEDKAIIKEQVAEATTQAETAAEHAESAATSASTAQENAALAGSYATAAEVSAQSILPKLDAAETAAAAASESAAVAMASVERAEGAAVAAESAAVAAVEKVSDLEKEVALLNTALTQGGITAKATTETAYNERITADGLNVLDGSLAKLGKVVGSTVKCNNLIPFPYSQTEKTVSGITFTMQEDGGVLVKGTATANATFAIYSNCKLFSAYVGAFANGTPAVKDGYCMSATAILKSGNAPKVAYENYSSTPNNGFVYLLAENGKDYDCVVYPMINEGTTALPYQPYFAGLKNASFAGIESTGRNLFNAKAIKNTNIKVNSDGSEILMPLYTIGNGATKTDATLSELCPDLRVGDTVYLNYEQSTYSGNGLIYIGTPSEYIWYINTSHTITENDLKSPVNLYGNRFISGYTEQITLLDFRIVRVKNAPFAPYIETTVFNFPKTELGEWDKVEFENQKVVRGTETIVFNGTENWTDYTSAGGIKSFQLGLSKKSIAYTCISNFYNKRKNADFELGNGECQNGSWVVIYKDDNYTTVADWKAHLAELYASGNPLTIAYESTTYTEETIVNSNEYKVHSGGTERVLGNDNAEYGVKNTLSQNYIVVKE